MTETHLAASPSRDISLRRDEQITDEIESRGACDFEAGRSASSASIALKATKRDRLVEQVVVIEVIGEARQRLMQQPTDLYHQSGALLDQVEPVTLGDDSNRFSPMSR